MLHSGLAGSLGLEFIVEASQKTAEEKWSLLAQDTISSLFDEFKEANLPLLHHLLNRPGFFAPV